MTEVAKTATGAGRHSVRSYAKHRGCHHRAVQKAIEAGRLARSVVMVEGVARIASFELADEEWTANTQHLKRANFAAGHEAAPPTPPWDPLNDDDFQEVGPRMYVGFDDREGVQVGLRVEPAELFRAIRSREEEEHVQLALSQAEARRLGEVLLEMGSRRLTTAEREIVQ